MMSTFELAPAAVARVGSVPLEALESLRAPRLARRAAEDDEDAFSAEYERVLQTHRHRLWTHTVGAPRVRCGLALSSPSLVADLRQSTPSPRRNKRARHLDTSLYRYLARATGRIEPCGLWTSVTLARLGPQPETTVATCAPKSHVAPDLGPFRELVQRLARREPYRSRGPYRLDPTLQADDAGGWCHARRLDDGRLRWTTLPASEVWGLLVERCGDGRPRSIDTMVEALRPALSEQVGRALLDFALDADLLHGGLVFPARFDDPWNALEQMEARLDPEHRAPWARARLQLTRSCGDVEQALDAALVASDDATTHAATVLAGQRRTREIIDALASALALPCPSIPTAILRCDETAPFRISLGQRDRARLEVLLARWSSLEARHHTDRRWVAEAVRAATSCPEGRVTATPSEEPTRPEPDPCSPGPSAGPPMGALVFRPGADGLATPWVRGLSYAPTVTHARHAYHLAERGDPLLPWFRAVYRDIERTDGVRIADLSFVTASSPNLLARPRYVEPTIDPWGASSSGPPLDQLRLVLGPSPSAVLLAQGSARWSAQVFTPLVIPSSDVITHRLMATSFDDRSHASASTDTERAPVEPDPLLSRPRRLRLTDAEVEGLVAARGAPRFARWQHLVRRHGLSRWVRVYCGARPGLLIPTDGPLPLEAAFEGVSAKPSKADDPQRRPMPEVIVEEVRDDAWLPGPRGRHFVEFVLPVRRTPSAWTRPPAAPHPQVCAHAAV